MAREMTGPQEKLLMDIDRALDGEVWCHGARWRTARNLVQKGLVACGGGRLVRLTRAGRERVEEIKAKEAI